MPYLTVFTDEVPDLTDETFLAPLTIGTGVALPAGVVAYGARFWVPDTPPTGPVTGGLYTPGGTLVASATFGSLTPGGWAEVLFSSPVTIASAGTWTVAVGPLDRYAQATGLHAADIKHGPAYAPASPNGLTAFGASFTRPTGDAFGDSFLADLLYAGAADTAAGTDTGGSFTRRVNSDGATAPFTGDGTGTLTITAATDTATGTDTGGKFTRALNPDTAAGTDTSATGPARSSRTSPTAAGGTRQPPYRATGGTR